MVAFDPTEESGRDLPEGSGLPARNDGFTGLTSLIGATEAATLLTVTPDRIAVMVEQGLLGVVESGGRPAFWPAEVLALRLLGG